MNSQRLFQLAQDSLARGQNNDAIEYLSELLSEEPDDADAHALLALALLGKKRVYAARVEAQRSLELEPESFFTHIAVGSIEIASRHFASAEKHLETAISLHPDSSLGYYKLSHLYHLWDKPAEALKHIDIACSLDPDDLDCTSMKARLLNASGRKDEATAILRDALESDPEHLDSLVTLGHIQLASGNINQARENALWALQLDPDNEAAMQLLVSIKARESFLLGVWWRFQAFITSGGNTRAIILLIGMYLFYRAGLVMLTENKMDEWSSFASGIWLAFCVYTWVAPAIFKRSLQREIQQVELKPSF
jgi:tetratricopeptide (TPR) repeat protein